MQARLSKLLLRPAQTRILTVVSLTLGQVEVLETIIDLFYMRGTDDNGVLMFNRTDSKKTLMLHYVLVTALLLEDCDLQPQQVFSHCTAPSYVLHHGC